MPTPSRRFPPTLAHSALPQAKPTLSRFVTDTPPMCVFGCSNSSSNTFDGFPIDCELKALFELPFSYDGGGSSSDACAELPFERFLRVPSSSFHSTDSRARLTQPFFMDAGPFCLLLGLVIYFPSLLSDQLQQEQQPRTYNQSDQSGVPSVVVVIRRRTRRFGQPRDSVAVVAATVPAH